MRVKLILSLVSFALLACAAVAQVVTSRLSGAVTDPQGAAIPGAQVTVVNGETGAKFETTSSEGGEWNVPSLQTGSYRLTVSAKGFKTAVISNVLLEPNVPGTVNAKLQIGAVTESIEVQTGGEVVQTESATVSSTMTGRQISDLPFLSRNALDLMISQPGTATVGTQRSTSINGLNQSTMNITLDGINIQDNDLKSSDGFLAWLMPRADAVEEVSIQSAALGAESSGEGAAQIKFVTKSGTNQFHGGLFWQIRNDVFSSNYYFNTINRLPRDRINLNQFGGRLGGPILKNRLFFFLSDDELRLPQTNNSSALLLTSDAMKGIFQYKDTAGVMRSVDLYAVAAAGNATLPSGTRPFTAMPDPTALKIFQQMAALATPDHGTLRERVTRYADYSRNDFLFQNPGHNHRRYPTFKLDWNANSKNQVSFIHHYQSYVANPDVVNSVVPVMPGTGAVLGTDATGAQRRIAFSGVATVRSVLTPRLTNEARFGVLGGPMLLRDDIAAGLFAQWKGYAPTFGFVTDPYTGRTQYRRTPPLWQGGEGLTWSRGAHLLNLGSSFSRIDIFVSNTGTEKVPVVAFGIAANDPINTGATSVFTTANFPNSTPTNRSDAAALYANLTGRVSGITSSVNLNEKSHQYGPYPAIDRVHQSQYGLYLQGSWKFRPTLTFNYGVRWDVQLPYVNTNAVYSKVGIEGVWGVSGVGHLFLPGYMPGKVPQYYATKADEPAYPAYWKSFQPSLGFAWQTPANESGLLRRLLGRNGVVLRGGYSISSVREGMDVFLSNGWGTNQGQSLSTSVSPGSTPADFGAPGSVLFRDATLPARSYPTAPNYPLPVLAGNGVYDFDPHLRPGYVQSWNFSMQREITRNTVLDIRYVGNHGTSLWRRYDINEVNIIENGFLDEFKVAQNNLAVARASNPSSVNFGNQGLPGQKNIPIISTALGLSSDTTFATYLTQAQAGRFADAIAFNTARMGRLWAAGYPANFFVANPSTMGGAAMVTTNGGQSTYNALQIEVRRRLSSGVQVQGSYVWSKSLSNMFSSRSGARSQPTTLRNPGYDKGPSPWDIRNNVKLNWIYELPFGPGRRFLRSASLPGVSRILEGWQISAVTRVQSGTPELIRSGRMVLNSAGNQGVEADGGVVLHNITTQQLQSMVHIRKAPNGIVYYLPQQVVDNTMAAFEVGGKSLRDLDPNAPYIGPPTVAGQLGNRVSLYGPWQQHYDFSVIKKTKIAEKKEIEFRAQFLNLFNLTNFYFGLVTYQTIGAGFGQTTTAYRDFTVAGTNNPGGRVIEFALRFNF